MGELLANFVLFFAVIDPIGTVPVFIAVTQPYDEATRRVIAFKAAFFAALVLLFFVVAGEPILNAIEIPMEAFQIAGGIVLFLFALTMLFGESKPEEEIRMVRASHETAVFPLAVPSLASPGAMLAAVLLTDNAQNTVLEQAATTGVILAVLLVALVLMLLASYVHRLIGGAGAAIISRVMGMILASVAVANVLEGIHSYYGLA
ncbi:MAG: MarC family protein [Halieaceae bacterium]|nr:MarC family protein [Halieaceae bacterium]